MKKISLNDKGTKSELIERLEENVLGKKTFTGIKYQSKSNVVQHPHGKQCFHCGIKQKVLPYIVPKKEITYHFCSAECRFSAEIPKNRHGVITSKSQQQNDDHHQTFFDDGEEEKEKSGENFVKPKSQTVGMEEEEESDENFVKPKSQTEELNAVNEPEPKKFWYYEEVEESGENFVKPKSQIVGGEEEESDENFMKSQTQELNTVDEPEPKKKRRSSGVEKFLEENSEEIFMPSKLRSEIK